jgi:superfamily I DNA/RNA helicase
MVHADDIKNDRLSIYGEVHVNDRRMPGTSDQQLLADHWPSGHLAGKTTWLTDHARIAAEKFTGEKIVVASLTKAAAYEFASRGLSMIPDDQLGTLHMICNRALGKPALTERRYADWRAFLEQHGAPSRFCVFGREGPKGMDRNVALSEGDEILQRITILRNQHPGIFKDGSKLPRGVFLTRKQQAFRELWDAWKDDAQLMDFTDLLEECFDHVTRAPGDPRVMFGDEAQDWSQLEVQLFRDKWGQYAEKVLLVGDPDQAIYEWRGADPRIFLDHPVPETQKILLKQSYRVPRAVRNCALEWISRKIRAREPVEYDPRAEDGSAGQVDITFRVPERLGSLIDPILASEETCMILASCDYMLRPTITWLKEQGIPFGNPYRAGEKAWNPLRWGVPAKPGKNPECTKLDRVLAYLEPSVELRGKHNREWSWKDIQKWTEPLRAKGDDAVMAHGAKAEIGRYVKNQKLAGPYTMEAFMALFRGNHGTLAHQMNLDWWFGAMRLKEKAKYAYYEAIIKRFGQRALIEKPRIWIGTIHSVKGGEADNVILFPDLSPAASDLYQGAYPDPTVRLFYVAMTRAHKNLIICAPSSPNHVEIFQGLPNYQLSTSEKCEVPFDSLA